jgi:chitodextrinase
MRRGIRAFVAVVALASVPLVGGALGAASGASAAPLGVSLAGNQFLLDGQPFVPRGFNSIALLNSAWCTTSATAKAAAALTPTELQLARTAWNSNTLRFQVSQPVLAGPNGVAYAQQIETAVNTVLRSGFVVDISMQDQSRACGPGQPLPSVETEAAWSTLITNTALGQDPDVMFELYNEPASTPVSTATTNPSQSTWVDWQSGGRTIGPGSGWAAYVPVGHQDLVNFLRTTLNVPNVLIADGASKAGYLQGIPHLSDPGGADQIAYAVHPYVFTDGPAGWDTRWGYLTATNAVIATEWSYTGSNCGKAQQAMAPQLLAYLRNTVNVGVLGHALDDYAGGLVSDGALTPTECGSAHPGSGAAFLQDYMATFPTSVSDVPLAQGGLPPAAPAGLRATYGQNQINLSWTAATDPDGAVAAYDVYRDGLLVATTASATFSDYGVSTAVAHAYTVAAADTAGNVGPASDPLVALAPDHQAPSTPTGLKTTIAAQSITVSWTASTDNVGVTGYRVSRNGSPVLTTTAKSYTDSAVTQGTSYTYQVAALDAAGNVSAPASKTVVFPDTVKPTAPTKLTLTPGSKSITLKWAASTDNVGVKAYRVYRGTTLIATVASPALSYTNAALTTGVSYSYHLTAVDAAGNVSPASATVSAKAK